MRANSSNREICDCN